VVARTQQYRHRQIEQRANPLVLGRLAVVGHIAGDQHDIDRCRQPGNIPQDRRGPLDTALAGVDVDVAEMRDDDHTGTLGTPPQRVEIQSRTRGATAPSVGYLT
jgi:hypothetical protein